MSAFKTPMSASSYEANMKRIQLPCFIQPKLDGVRCVTDGRTFWSRNGKPFWSFNTFHLQKKSLSFLVDGEIMLEDRDADFEQIISVLKRNRHPQSEELRFHVFDVVTRSPFFQREHAVRELFRTFSFKENSGWHRVPTLVALDAEQLQRIHKKHLGLGHEGSMVRTHGGLYVHGKSRDLLKYKPMKDAEFEIIDVREAKGKDTGTPIFICACEGEDGDNTFRVRPMGTYRQRHLMWRRRARLIGQNLTVEFQNLTKYGKPRFPRAKILRDYE